MKKIFMGIAATLIAAPAMAGNLSGAYTYDPIISDGNMSVHVTGEYYNFGMNLETVTDAEGNLLHVGAKDLSCSKRKASGPQGTNYLIHAMYPGSGLASYDNSDWQSSFHGAAESIDVDDLEDSIVDAGQIQCFIIDIAHGQTLDPEYFAGIFLGNQFVLMGVYQEGTEESLDAFANLYNVDIYSNGTSFTDIFDTVVDYVRNNGPIFLTPSMFQ